jgi:hypothetical protein
MNLSAAVDIDPSWMLASVWQQLHTGDFTQNVQVNLSNAILAAYNRSFAWNTLTATLPVQTLAQWVKADINP